MGKRAHTYGCLCGHKQCSAMSMVWALLSFRTENKNTRAIEHSKWNIISVFRLLPFSFLCRYHTVFDSQTNWYERIIDTCINRAEIIPIGSRSHFPIQINPLSLVKNKRKHKRKKKWACVFRLLVGWLVGGHCHKERNRSWSRECGKGKGTFLGSHTSSAIESSCTLSPIWFLTRANNTSITNTNRTRYFTFVSDIVLVPQCLPKNIRRRRRQRTAGISEMEL